MQEAEDEAVEDVGLGDEAVVEAEVAHDGHEDEGAADDDVGPRLLEAGIVESLPRAVSVASVRNTSSAASRVRSK